MTTTGGLDASNVVFTNIATVTFDTGSATGQTLTGATLNGANINGTAGNNITTSSGNLSLIGSTLANINTITLTQGSSAVQTLTVDATTIVGLSITGTDNNDLITTSGAFSLQSGTVSNIATVTFDSGGTGGLTFTATGATLNGANITSTGGTGIITTASGNLNLTNSTLTGISTITLTQASTAQTLTVGATEISGLTVTGTLTSSSPDDVLVLVGAAVLNATNLGAITNFLTWTLADAAYTLTTAAANVASGATLTIDASAVTSAAVTVNVSLETDGTINYTAAAGSTP